MKRRILAGAGLTFLLVVGVAAGSTTTAVRALAFGGPIRVVYPLDYGSGDVVSIALGDLSGDGRPDMAIASAEDNAVYVVLNRGRGRFRTVAKTDAPAGYSAIADVNGDGKQDLVVMSGLAVSVLLNRGDGTLLPRADYAVGQVAGDDDALVP